MHSTYKITWLSNCSYMEVIMRAHTKYEFLWKIDLLTINMESPTFNAITLLHNLLGDYRKLGSTLNLLIDISY